MPNESVPRPNDLVELGTVRGAYGLRGWARIAPFSVDAEVLRKTRNWWLLRAGVAQKLNLTAVRPHGALLVAKWDGVDTPEAAEALKRAAIAVARSDFPALPAGEFYWVDLIGARVVNRSGVELGKVGGLRSNGAQDLLEVLGPGESGTSLLVPMIDRYVDRIDVEQKLVTVDWEMDW